MRCSFLGEPKDVPSKEAEALDTTAPRKKDAKQVNLAQ